MLANSIRRMRERRSGVENGFTLIELLIVIVILGILAGIVVFSVAGITDKGQTSACETEKTTVETAIEAYYASNNNTYPASTAALVGTFLRSTPKHYGTSGGGVLTGTCP